VSSASLLFNIQKRNRLKRESWIQMKKKFEVLENRSWLFTSHCEYGLIERTETSLIHFIWRSRANSHFDKKISSMNFRHDVLISINLRTIWEWILGLQKIDLIFQICIDLQDCIWNEDSLYKRFKYLLLRSSRLVDEKGKTSRIRNLGSYREVSAKNECRKKG